MKVELNEIIDQLTDAIGIREGFKVAALIDDNSEKKIVGWTIVEILEDGSLKYPDNDLNNFKDLKDLLRHYI